MPLRSLLLCAAGLVLAGLLLLFSVHADAAGPPREATELPWPRYLEHTPQYFPPSSEAAPAQKQVRCVYPVADLIIPIAGTPSNSDGKQQATQEDRLIQLICATISPQSWSQMGGPGSIDYFPIGMALVVCHTPDVQEQIADLLAALRRLQDVEVAVELRLITVSDECLSGLGVEEGKAGVAPVINLLDEAQRKLLLEAVQGDQRSNILQAPKLTVFNGQKATLDLSEKQCFVTGFEMVQAGTKIVPLPKAKNVNTGLRISVLPVVSADQRTVTLQLGVSLARMDEAKLPGQASRFSTRSFETTLKLADGATALVNGWTQHREVRNQVALPVLTKVPYIDHLFRTISYGKEREHLLVLVTSRIIVRQQEENKPATEALPSSSSAGPIEAAEPAEDSNKAAAGTEQSESETPPNSSPEASVARADHEKVPLKHVNHRSFRLEYALENVGPSGVEKIAVWVWHASRWQRYGEAVPARGHATITVPADGRWGFTLIPYSGIGRAQPSPGVGDQPQVWVEVDTETPRVSIDSADAGFFNASRKEPRQATVRLGYHCSDAHLKPYPASISYAASADGPWTELSSGLEAEGIFEHALEGLPHQFYLRVLAEDEAGNVGQAVSGLIKADVKIPRVGELKVKVEE
jgi:hypothetical protein